MAFIKDLEHCDYFPVECEALTAIGWLTHDVEFEHGEVPRDFFDKLSQLCKSPWQSFVSAGVHFCELCQFQAPGFTSNVYVPHRGRIYVAPEAIIHYVASHRYRPPDVFIRAVLECPPMNSMEYKKALLANGGRSLVHSVDP